MPYPKQMQLVSELVVSGNLPSRDCDIVVHGLLTVMDVLSHIQTLPSSFFTPFRGMKSVVWCSCCEPSEWEGFSWTVVCLGS